jgi:hypothetical protein
MNIVQQFKYNNSNDYELIKIVQELHVITCIKLKF